MHKQRILIVGAGYSGSRLAVEFRLQTQKDRSFIELIGFLDDDDKKLNQIIEGYPILGKILDLESIVKNYKVDQVYFAIPSASPATIRLLIRLCRQANIDYVTLPTLWKIDYFTHFSEQVRELSFEDLFSREKKQFDYSHIQKKIIGRTIFISGGGGSIGSELTSQILRFAPKRIILYDHSEFNLFMIQQELRHYIERRQQDDPNFWCDIILIVGDLRNFSKINYLLQKEKPDYVFHAAAYKHVPLMEDHPLEALQVNLLGTIYLLEAALAAGVKQFLFLSTDKAVRPQSIMGATKRLAERAAAAYAHISPQMQIKAVRFGNVLGSSGSVIPTFRDQIIRGGPVTITHPDVSRFFMSIPEAVQLVLEAFVAEESDGIFILDMGKPIRIFDLAADLILLHGYEPEKFPIQYIGLRPGEKLHEELFLTSEEVEAGPHPRIMRARFSSNAKSNPKQAAEWIQNIKNWILSLDANLDISAETSILKQEIMRKANDDSINN